MAPYFGMMELEDVALAGYRRGFQAAGSRNQENIRPPLRGGFALQARGA